MFITVYLYCMKLCQREDSNLHAFAPASKAGVSAKFHHSGMYVWCAATPKASRWLVTTKWGFTVPAKRLRLPRIQP